jgi:tRNA uridine 5-carbamoylmethylation protein Kti12
MSLVVNLFAGPGAGKSTMAAALFAALKRQGVSCELVTEFAKDKVWEESYAVLDNQLYIFGKQFHRLRRLFGKVDVIVTDSPLLLSLYYGCRESYVFKALVMEQHNKMATLNLFVERDASREYDERGRMQTLDEAVAIDKSLKKLLEDNEVEYVSVPADESGMPVMTSLVTGWLEMFGS